MQPSHPYLAAAHLFSDLCYKAGSADMALAAPKQCSTCRMFNIHLISTAGVGPEDIDRCLQCPCDDDPDRGGAACCKACITQTPGPPRSYFFEYNVTYRYDAAACTQHCHEPGDGRGMLIQPCVSANHASVLCLSGQVPREVKSGAAVDIRAAADMGTPRRRTFA